MVNGRIPTNIGDLPTSQSPMDDSRVYKGILRKMQKKADKNGNPYYAIMVEVLEGDFEGRMVMDNYIREPKTPEEFAAERVELEGGTEEVTKRDRIRSEDVSVKFGRFSRSFGLKGEVNFDDEHWFDKYVNDAIGSFTINNQEFPQGSGTLRAYVADYML